VDVIIRISCYGLTITSTYTSLLPPHLAARTSSSGEALSASLPRSTHSSSLTNIATLAQSRPLIESCTQLALMLLACRCQADITAKIDKGFLLLTLYLH